jgi:hypothetical protein
MARSANMPKGKKVTKHIKNTKQKAKPTHAKGAEPDSANEAMKHAAAHALATSIDHTPYDLGYSFK